MNADLPGSPYKGLAPFDDSDLDALFFFGREREREVIIANLVASRLTVLYGESGVGKSSLLRAGVAHELRQEQDVTVTVFSSWTEGSALPIRAAEQAAENGSEVYLVLDQFEEYFLYHGDESGPETLAVLLPELLRRADIRVNVLIAVREDALGQLETFKGRIPKVLANYLRLPHLDRAGGRAAIAGPIRRWNELAGPEEQVEAEAALIEEVLDETAAGRVDFGRPERGAVEEPESPGLIEAPFLQLVMERLWETELESGSRVLGVETLRRLGGAEAIVRAHLESALDALTPAEKDVAAAVFNHLVTPSGTKVAHRSADLADYARIEEDALRPVLATLEHERILRSVDGAGDSVGRYEIFHDVLADAVLGWRARHRLELERQVAERRHRRLLIVVAASLVALAGVTAVAAYALVERGRSQAQAHHARARELEATALGGLSVDPRQSLVDALTAARLEPGRRAETVLRTALLGMRLLGVLKTPQPVVTVAYSPTGRLALVASGRRVRLYDPGTHRLVRVLQTGAPTTAAAFDGDSRVLTGALDGTARLWDVATGRSVLTLRGPGSVSSVALASDGSLLLVTRTRGPAIVSRPDGRLVVSLPQTGRTLRGIFAPGARLVATIASDPAKHVKAYIFDLAGGRLLHVLPPRGVSDLAFSPQSAFLAVGSSDGTTTLWRPFSGRLVGAFAAAGGGPIADVAFSPDGALLAIASLDGGVRVWTVATGGRLYYFVGHIGHVVAVAWSPNGQVLADASSDGTAHIWAIKGLVESGGLVASLAGHRGPVTSVAFSPNGLTLLTGSDDGTARIWDSHTEERLRLLGSHRGPVAMASFSPDGLLALSASSDGTARIWNVRHRRLVRKLVHPAPVVFAAFSRDGSTIVTAAGSSVYLWRTTGRLLRRIGAPAPVSAAQLSSDQKLVLLGAGRSVELHDAGTGRRIARLLLDNPVSSASLDADGARIATADTKGVVQVWRAGGGLVWHARAVGCRSVVFTPGGARLAAACADGAARIWDAASGRLLQVLRTGVRPKPLTDIVFSSDGRLLLTTRSDGGAQVWDVRTGQQVYNLVGQFGHIAAGAFSADGRWIATAGPITAILWPTDTGRLLFYLRGPTEQVTSVSFSPGGKELLTSSEDGSVRLYACSVCGHLQDLEERAQADLDRTAPR